jgi:hypothetical protein
MGVNSASCNSGAPGFFHANNSYWRSFNMETFAGSREYNVSSVSFGIEAADAGPNPTQRVTVRLHRQTSGIFPGGTWAQIATTTVNVANQSQTVLSVPLVATVPAGTTQLIMEVSTPDGRAPVNHSFFIGSNGAPETGPSYISAATCDMTTPTDVSTIGYPDMHLVFNINGACVTPTPTPIPGMLANISTRLQVGTGARVMIAGFVVQGSAPKRVLIRAVGPSMAQFGVPDVLANPRLELHDNTNVIGRNDDWETTQLGGVIISDQVAEIQNSGMAPIDSAESALIAVLTPGSYTAIVEGISGGTGVGSVEVYDLDATSGSLLANISTRGFVQTGDNVMIGGFIVVTHPTRVIVRVIGPSLTQLGVPDALANPQLELNDATSTIARNDNWQTTQLGGIITADQVTEIQSSLLAPMSSAESAIIATLQPGSYTAIVRGVSNTSGNALVEVYALP